VGFPHSSAAVDVKLRFSERAMKRGICNVEIGVEPNADVQYAFGPSNAPSDFFVAGQFLLHVDGIHFGVEGFDLF